ncbi:glycosyltransferase family 2 protein [Bernardetia sp. ABR2-2B]|uniref:glycosyltransferase n=1 Tax=Bernardetia sp. ABR2-2B TaxID=3127472 RepID=UPI0030CAC42F
MRKISILIAVRNEEQLILSCLDNLKKSINEFYKIEENNHNFNLETLIGDDNDTNTEDKSAEIIKEFIERNKGLDFNYFKIDRTKKELIKNNLKGKINVVHQLINHSAGKTIILLDADILVNPNWLKELLTKYYQNENIKMIMGTTIPNPNQDSFFTKFQTIDWLFGQGILAIFSWLGFPQTAMGNNLIFDRKIYEELGGYESIEFSVTEDVALFKTFQKYIKEQSCLTLQSVRQNKQNKNQFFLHLFNSQSLAFTEAEPTLKYWILQHHRWFCGAWQFSNFLKKGILLIYLFRIIFFIGVILSGNIYLIFSTLLLLGINFLLIISFFVRLKLKVSFSTILQALLFCLMESFLYFLVGVYFLKTKNVKWKGREF